MVVPTRGRPAELRRCLEAVAAQASADAFEILVVDDGPSGSGAETAAGMAGARVVRLGGRGPAAARNAGVAAATAPVVCFTDDDCEPAPGWLEALLAPIEAGAALAAGPTVVPESANAYDRATQLIVDRLVSSSRSGFVPASNLACARSLLLELPFDERYPLYGEDRDWCARVHAAGHRYAWVAGAVVVHRPGLDLRGFLRKHERYGRGALRFRRSRPPSSQRESMRFYSSLLGHAARAGGAVAALVWAAQLATAAGLAHEALAPSRD